MIERDDGGPRQNDMRDLSLSNMLRMTRGDALAERSAEITDLRRQLAEAQTDRDRLQSVVAFRERTDRVSGVDALRAQWTYRRHLTEWAKADGKEIWWARWAWFQISYGRWV